ncbi:MAG: UDP-N-acetylglucosamine pyrophosphorylase [Lentisphaerae bacterium]|nr:UDP-N-acetylglucosamine pyrophosphorylase [Lentisphaerota bacterium]
METLLARGVRLPAPSTVYVDAAVLPERIAPGVEIHPGCRILGAATSIGPGCVLGREGPLTLDSCQLQSNVALAGGYVSGAAFLDGASLGADAHVRPGTILEEQAGGGHAVGLKQTLLFPFVTTGSLINFCDVLMAGGTDRRNHSEVGSSYVHFNFTPNQDKATASLVGDVPRGVMLDRAPIFLGGQGGLVGPARIAYGTVIAAGTVQRGDQLEPDRLVYGKRREGEREAAPRVYLNLRRLVANNLAYIGNVRALAQWYAHARTPFLQRTPYDAACLAGALTNLDLILRERVQRLGDVVQKLGITPAGPDPRSAAERAYQEQFAAAWPALAPRLSSPPAPELGASARAKFLSGFGAAGGAESYLDAVRSLDPSCRESGTAWLQAVVDAVADQNT